MRRFLMVAKVGSRIDPIVENNPGRLYTMMRSSHFSIIGSCKEQVVLKVKIE
jgi:hypothetical protein